MNWWRSWHGAPTDMKWMAIARKVNVSPGMVSAVAWALMDHASQANDRGSVDDFDVESYAIFSGWNEEDIENILTAFADKGITNGGKFTQWEKRQPRREDDSRDRVQAFRERKRNEEVTQSNDDVTDVTQCNAVKRSVTQCNGRTEQNRVEQSREDNELKSFKKLNIPISSRIDFSIHDDTENADANESSPEEGSDLSKYKYEPEHEEVAKLLATRRMENNPREKWPAPQSMAKWANDVRLMIERDKIPPDELVEVLEWSQQDDFWWKNIRSIPKFREQYPQLFVKMNEQRGVSRKNIANQSSGTRYNNAGKKVLEEHEIPFPDPEQVYTHLRPDRFPSNDHHRIWQRLLFDLQAHERSFIEDVLMPDWSGLYYRDGKFVHGLGDISQRKKEWYEMTGHYSANVA